MGSGIFTWISIITIAVVAICLGQKPPPQIQPHPPPPQKHPDFVRFGYCDATDTAPETSYLNCSSCMNRCGGIKDFSQHIYCSCDPGCVAYGDCCVDFQDICPDQFNASSLLRKHFQHRKTECYAVQTVPLSDKGIVEIRDIIPEWNQYNFVAICGQTGVACNRTSLYAILEPNFAIPVTDTATGINYVNYNCARCNDVTMVTPWIPQLACDPDIVPYENQNGSFMIDTTEKLELYLRNCQVNYMIPSTVQPRRYCGEFNRKCPPSCNNSDLIHRCENSYIVDYVEPRMRSFTTYDNLYCALCAGEIADTLTCAQIFYIDAAVGGTGGMFSLSLLFDFDPSDGVTVGRKACSFGQKWIAASQECRLVSCPDDQRLLEETCLPTSLNVTLSASLFFNSTEDLNSVSGNLESDNLLVDNLNKEFKELLPQEDKIMLSLNQNRSSEFILNLTLDIHLVFSKNSTFNLGADLGNLSENSIHAFDDELVLLMQRSGVNLGNVIIEVDDNVVFKQALLQDCTWFLFRNDEFIHENDTVIVTSTNKVYTIERYRLVKDEALVCISNDDMDTVRIDVSESLGILTLVLITLSIICLIIRLVLQFKVTYYTSFAGKLHFNLCLSLCLAFLMLIIGGSISLTKIVKLCAAFGTLMYWFFLSTFFWMFAVTFDTWLVFRPSATFVKVDDTSKSLARYILPCWLIPAIVAVIVACLDFGSIERRFQPQFGVNLCWFNQRYALMVYFAIPVALLTILTTIFFILTVVYLRRTLSSSARPSSDKESHQIWIYFRLYVLMGISWIIGFVAAFVGHDVLWVIFIILNASQGILIFISFVLNRKVLDEIRTLRKRPTRTGTAVTTSTDLTSSSSHAKSYVPTKREESTA